MTVASPGGIPDEADPYPIVFREFLYADLERARSLLAQRLGGVPQESRATDSTVKNLTVGAKSVLGASRESKAEGYEQRSLLDAIFPLLEDVLDTEEWLTDISDIVGDADSHDPARLQSIVTPGSLVRLTGDWQLFDPTYFAHTLAGIAAAADGIAALGGAPQDAPDANADEGQGGRAGSANSPRLEDIIEDFPPHIMGGLGADAFRAMVKVSRGMFAESGLHLLLSPPEQDGWTVTSRLQRGRQYLDAEPDILFSRYGTAPLEWTVVGTIGHFSQRVDASALSDINFVNADGTASRSKFASTVNLLISFMANQGFADRPPFPGFSIVPLAVYRVIPGRIPRAH